MRSPPSSLRQKLLLATTIPTAALLIAYGWLAYRVAQQGLEDELGARLVAIGQSISSDLSGGLDAAQLDRLDPSKKRVIKRLQDRLERARAMTGARRIFLFDHELKSLIDTDPEVQLGQRIYSLDADQVEVTRALTELTPSSSVLFTDERGAYYKNAYVPVFLDPEHTKPVAGLGVVASAEYFTLLSMFAQALLLIGLLGVMATCAIAILFARRLVAPVNDLVAAAERLASGDMTTPVPTAEARADELAILASSFEHMRGAILERDQQLQMMLSGIAHEVRNPLGGMELFVGLLREDLTWMESSDAQRDMLDKVNKIERELHYLARVVTDFLDFARHKTPELSRFEAASFVAEIEALMASQADEAQVMLSAQLDPQDLELLAEPDALRSAVINVIRNAIQACGAGGHVRLTLSAPEPLQRVIEIRDDGCGIPQEHLDAIHTPFYTTKEKGSGLGLALTKKILTQHGGSLHVSSALGQGTTIRFTLPFDPDAPQLPSSSANIPEGWLG